MYDETDSLPDALNAWLEWLTRQGNKLSPEARAESLRVLRQIEQALARGDLPLAARFLTLFAQKHGVTLPTDNESYEPFRGGNLRGTDDRYRSPSLAGDLRSILTRIDRVITGHLSAPPTSTTPANPTAPATPAVAPITTYPEVRAPAEARLRTTFPVHITTRARPTPDAAGKLVFPRTRPGPVDVEVAIDLLDSALEAAENGTPLEQPLRVHESGNSAEITFELFAKAEGVPRFDVVFRQGGTEKMRVERRVVIAPPRPPAPPPAPGAPAASAAAAPATPAASAAAAPGAPAASAAPTAAASGHSPEIEVDGALVSSPANPISIGAPFEGLVLRLIPRGVGHDVRSVLATLRGAAWKGPPLEYRAELPQQVWQTIVRVCQQLPDSTLRDLAAAETRLENIGARLGEQLLGPAILQALADFPEGTSLHIESDDAWVPWELLCVRAGGGTGTFFLGERFAVTRWLQVGYARDALPVTRAVLVAPRSARLTVAAERRALSDLFGAPEELARVGEVQKMLQAAPRTVLHYVCHGASAPDLPFPDILALEDGPLHVVDVPRPPPGTLGKLDGAVVFVNACEAQIATPSVWGIGGWAEAFLEAGAGAFIAPSWSVRDVPASAFARSFYDHATRLPLGEAARLARNAARSVGVPCRLAYAVYCSPNTRLALPPAGAAG